MANTMEARFKNLEERVAQLEKLAAAKAAVPAQASAPAGAAQ